jgi:hypothetical protein
VRLPRSLWWGTRASMARWGTRPSPTVGAPAERLTQRKGGALVGHASRASIDAGRVIPSARRLRGANPERPQLMTLNLSFAGLESW